jgi:voltage-gated potassium channel
MADSIPTVVIGPERRALRSRLKLPIAMLLATHAVGVLGYHWLWRAQGGTWMDALFMTFTTVATIGYGEVKPLDDTGRIFTIFIATAGISSLFYVFTVGLDHLTSDAVRQARRRRRMQQQIQKLENHVVLAGFGRVGREAAHELRGAGVPVVVVEPSREVAAAAAEAGFLVVNGDATEDAILEAAGIKHARGLVVTIATDATNLYVILSARLLNPKLFIVCRSVDEASVPKLLRAGANRAISPYAIGGRRLAHLLLSPKLVELFETAFQRGKRPIRIADLELPVAAAERPLRWLLESGGAGSAALAIVRGEQVIPAPAPDLPLAEGDHVFFLGTDAQIAAAEKVLAA